MVNSEDIIATYCFSGVKSSIQGTVPQKEQRIVSRQPMKSCVLGMMVLWDAAGYQMYIYIYPYIYIYTYHIIHIIYTYYYLITTTCIGGCRTYLRFKWNISFYTKNNILEMQKW